MYTYVYYLSISKPLRKELAPTVLGRTPVAVYLRRHTEWIWDAPIWVQGKPIIPLRKTKGSIPRDVGIRWDYTPQTPQIEIERGILWAKTWGCGVWTIWGAGIKLSKKTHIITPNSNRINGFWSLDGSILRRIGLSLGEQPSCFPRTFHILGVAGVDSTILHPKGIPTWG